MKFSVSRWYSLVAVTLHHRHVQIFLWVASSSIGNPLFLQPVHLRRKQSVVMESSFCLRFLFLITPRTYAELTTFAMLRPLHSQSSGPARALPKVAAFSMTLLACL